MDLLKQHNLELKRNLVKTIGKKSPYTNHEILLSFLNSNPTKWYFEWEIPNNLPLGWVGNQKRRRLQELAQKNKILVNKAGRYAIYSSL